MPSWARSSRIERRAVAAALAACLFCPDAPANGRMPGATALTVGAGGTDRVVVRATYGIVSSADGGRRWRWICEQAVGVSGEADPPLAVTGDGTFVLVNPRGGLLVSHDEGCTWAAGPALLDGTKTVDVASDAGNAGRVVALASTVATIDDEGLVTYSNVVAESGDDGRTWTALGALPPDFVAETLEIAPSDPLRLYASGTANDDPLTGVVLRTVNGGATWSRFTLSLPAASGSVFISAIHPKDPDRLWIRVPARGDTFGFFPASLLVSEDGGEHFNLVARTDRAMFGFALSPAGDQLAYGGPFDGLYVGSSTGTSFTKVSPLGVRCLKWRSTGLYACASQPADPFTLGLSPEADGVFEPLYDARATCPAACPAGGAYAAACEAPWGVIGPAIGASAACEVPWAGSDAGATGDAAAGGSAGSGSDAGMGAGGAAGSAGSTGSTGSAGSAGSAGSGSTTAMRPDGSLGHDPDAAIAAPRPRGSDCRCSAGERRARWTDLIPFAALAIACSARRWSTSQAKRPPSNENGR